MVRSIDLKKPAIDFACETLPNVLTKATNNAKNNEEVLL